MRHSLFGNNNNNYNNNNNNNVKKKKKKKDNGKPFYFILFLHFCNFTLVIIFTGFYFCFDHWQLQCTCVRFRLAAEIITVNYYPSQFSNEWANEWNAAMADTATETCTKVLLSTAKSTAMECWSRGSFRRRWPASTSASGRQTSDMATESVTTFLKVLFVDVYIVLVHCIV